MSTTAGPALVAALDADVDRLCEAEPQVREDLPDSVHSMRVATRRLRSVLKSYRKVLRRTPTTELRDELRWLAGLLGVARDAEVRAERFTALLSESGIAVPEDAEPLADTESPGSTTDSANAGSSGDCTVAVSDNVVLLAEESALGNTEVPGGKPSLVTDFGAHLVAVERRVYAGAHAAILDGLDSRRYRTLTDRLHALTADPPLRTAHAELPADEVFADVLRHDFHELRHLVRTEPDPSDPARVEHLHDIRKAAKRLRYSAEAAKAVLGDPAATLARSAKKLQGVLGDHRDAVESLATLHAHAPDPVTPSYQRMCDAEEAAAAKALESYPAATDFLHHHPL
ncbi:CHAD domain-containing protein [Nocardia jejuensis]|uniref:CHAD domain-containing protein n=1 Tax=Nocardia jejuensis TaxID=328049 RepID=UPI0008372AF0|nr:CHAD domain-containing protein [Nocardia jejuensis]